MRPPGRPAVSQRARFLLLAAFFSQGTFADTEAARFSQAQAELGARVAERYCTKCHDATYFAGALYTAVQGQPVAYLLDPIRATMPQDRPGTLKPRHTAALIAWIMSLNGITPSDVELPEDYGRLSSMILPKT